MADDQTNPFTIAGMAGMMMPNPYTQYKGQLPIPGYSGTPTDAQGNPIQSFLDAQAQNAAAPGTTLNTPPPAATPSNNGAFSPDQAARILQGTGQWGINSSGGGGGAGGGVNNQAALDAQASMSAGYRPQATQPAATAAPAAGAGGGPVDMRQAYLTALSNPGKVTTPGANVPQAAPLGTPSVLNSFLAAHPGGGGAGAGNYSNKGFFDTLNQLRSA